MTGRGRAPARPRSLLRDEHHASHGIPSAFAARRAQGAAPTRSGTGASLRVDDLDVALAAVEGLGACALGEAIAFPTGRAVYVRESAGSVIELYEPTEEHA